MPRDQSIHARADTEAIMTHYDHALISEPTIDKCMAELNRTSLNGYEVVAGYAVNVPANENARFPVESVRHYFLIRRKVEVSPDH